MDNDYLSKIKADREETSRKAEEDKRANLIVEAVGASGKDTKNEVTTAIHDLMLATLVSKDPRLVEVSKGLSALFTEINKASKSFEGSALKDIPKVQQKIVDALQSIPDTIAEADRSPELVPHLENIVKAINSKDTSPRVNVASSPINLAPVTKAIESLEKSIKKIEPKEAKEMDISVLERSMHSVEQAINGLRFPTANYILPYKDPTTGKATQVTLDSSGNIPITGSITVDTTGLATSAKQDAQTALLTTIDADTSNLDVALSTRATAAKQDTGNTSLSSIDGKITAVNTGAVVVSSSALPSGAATAAKQPALGTAGTASADVITVQGRAAMTPLLTDGSATTQPVSGTVTANAGSGTMAVSNAGLTELEAAINSSKVDVNIASSAVASGGTSAADDADFTAGSTAGTPAMGVYESTPTTVTDGDLGTVGITTGRRLKTSATIDAALPAGTNNIGDVDVLSSALPTGAATSTIQTDGSQKTQIVDAGGEQVTVTGGKLDVNATVSGGVGSSAVDDAAFAIATDSGTPVMGLFDDVAPDSVNEGDVGVTRMSANRNAYTTIRDAAGNERGVNVTAGNALTVDASATTQPVSGTFWQATQPVSGTVTANAGTNLNTSALALAATQTDKSQFTKITDGTDTALVTASGEQNVLESNSAAIKTAVETIDNAVSGAGFNVTQVGGTNIDTNSGNKSAGTQRVVLATDQPALSTAMPVSYATTGSGTATGALRVELPTNGTGVVGLNAGTNAIGKLAANSGVDIGDVDVTSAVSATMDHGSNLDIDAAAEQITSTSFACKFGVTLRAPIANTGILYIGNSDVTASGTAATDGIPLYPGDSLFLPVTNSNIPYAIASAVNQAIYWIAV